MWFDELSALLRETHSVWSSRAFAPPPPSWQETWPELIGWAQRRARRCALSELSRPATGEELPAPARRWAERAHELCRLPRLSAREIGREVTERERRYVPGAKWAQVAAFMARIPEGLAGHSWVEWCAGKGHLARCFSLSRDVTVRRLELNATLLRDGDGLARRVGAVVPGVVADVLSHSVGESLDPRDQVLALHACGDLHRTLVRLLIDGKVSAIALSPCCYHRSTQQTYRPLSSVARLQGTTLTREMLAFAVRQVMPHRQRHMERLQREHAWRLAFDRWRSDADAAGTFLPQASIPDAWLSGSFPQFAEALARRMALTAQPATCDWEELEAHGWAALKRVRAVGQIRAIFQRPLELWLVLDTALALDELGIPLRLGTFCDAAITPRNLLLLAGAGFVGE